MTHLPSLGPRGEGWVLIQGVLLVVVAAFAFSLISQEFQESDGFLAAALTAGGILLVGGLVFYTDIKESAKEIGTLSAVYFGLLLGLLLG